MKNVTRAAAAVGALALIGPAPARAGTIDPLVGQQWGYARIGADAAHAVATGRGVTVAVIDSGVDTATPDLKGALLGGKSFVAGGQMADGLGHGTHVAGIIGARADNGIGIAGVAPKAKILPIRVLDAKGAGDLKTVAAAVDYAREQGAQVINLSLGPTLPVDAVTDSVEQLDQALTKLGISSGLNDAVQRAVDANIVVVAAAGNASLPICQLPSARGHVLCVGATKRADTYASFSNFGLGLGVVAPGGATLDAGKPGTGIMSTLPGGGFGEMTGTSQATPHVAGIAAMLTEVGIRGQAAVQRIIATTNDLGAKGADLTYGYGEVSATRALAGLKPVARVSLPTTQHRATVLKQGILVRAIASNSGRATITAAMKTKRVGRARPKLTAGVPVSLRVKPATASRKLLAHRSRSVISLKIALPGSAIMVKRVTIKP